MALPPKLAELVDDFAAVDSSDRVELLLELSRELPELPDRYAGHHELMERVPECQSPLFLAVEVGADAEDVPRVRLFFDAPPQSPTTRGFAAIMHAGLDGEPVGAVLAVPEDFYADLGLADVVSPLRLRGMTAMLGRIKRQIVIRARS
ncbi:MAG: SufE family protein [Pseudonocardia sp.]